MEKHLKQLYVLVIENSTLDTAAIINILWNVGIYKLSIVVEKRISKWEMQKSIKKLLSFIFW